MNLLPLLKSHLKSDVMLDLLNTWDAQVVYEYDRTYENIPDEYWASIHREGVCFNFNDKPPLNILSDYVSPASLSRGLTRDRCFECWQAVSKHLLRCSFAADYVCGGQALERLARKNGAGDSPRRLVSNFHLLRLFGLRLILH